MSLRPAPLARLAMTATAVTAAAVSLGACGTPPAPRRAPSANQQILMAAELALDCLGGSGAGCLQPSAAAGGWLAQGQLELIATVPAPILGRQLLSAYDRIETGNEAGQRLAKLANEARPMARDRSCKPSAATPLGERLRQRRDALIQMAENLGLAATSLAAVIRELDARAQPLDGAVLVSARCRQGELFVLLQRAGGAASPEGAAASFDDEAGRASSAPHRGWRPVAISANRRALERGAPLAAPAPTRPIDDPPAPDGVDPWIPVGELDL